MIPTLRPYQSAFVGDIRAAYASGYRSVLGVLPTGGGKTVSFSYMAASAAARGKRVGLVAHRVELLDQISSSLSDFGVRHGFVAPGRGSDPFANVQVCSVMALARRAERYRTNPFDLLIVDEAHHAASGSSWGQVIALHTDKRVLGVTATPERLSGEPLDCFQRMVCGPTTADLIGIGALSPYRCYAPKTADLTGVRKRMGDYAKDDLAQALDKPTITGDAVVEYRRRASGKRAVAFCVSVAHAEHVAAAFRTNGIPAESVDGKMDRGARRAALDRFRVGATLVLTAADLVSEGFDVPAIEAAILLRPTQSVALYLQQVGRALRPQAGKTAIILDHASNVLTHGLPDDEREWSLEGRKRGPSKPGVPTVSIRTCTTCFGVFRPAPVCPLCGTAVASEGRKVEEVDGELDEIDAEMVRRSRRAEEGAARTKDELVRLAQSRGYKNPNAWAAMRLHFREAARNKTYPYGNRNRALAR